MELKHQLLSALNGEARNAVPTAQQFVSDYKYKAALLKDVGDYINFEGNDGKSYKAVRTGKGVTDFKITPS